MSSTQYFPIPPEIFARACGTVTGRVSRLPFLRNSVSVTGQAVGAAMECLNAVPAKTLLILTPQGQERDREDGLDRCIGERLQIQGRAAAPVIAEVLYSAGIAKPVLIMDRHARCERRGIRLLPQWTWHIASTLPPSMRCGGDAGDEQGGSWLDLCPVCRTGVLERVTGKQLFGIPRTDFYIECSRCGAKFIPVGPAFRLVSVATVRDPLWRRHLDRTCSPEEWAVIARGCRKAGSPAPRPAVQKPAGPALTAAAVLLTALKDGSLAVPVAGKTLYFRPVPLRFSASVRGDVFVRVQKTLEDLLLQPAFEHLRSPVNARYFPYLSMKAGVFLHHLKERHDPFYRGFLNPYGDEKFGTFLAEDSKDAKKRGVIIVVANRGLYDVIGSPDPLHTTISSRLGRVGPEDCLLSGDAVRCRANALLCTSRKEAGLYFHPVEDEDDRLAVFHALCDPVTVG